MKTIRRVMFALLRYSGVPFLLRETVQRKKVTIVLLHDIPEETAMRHFSYLASAYSVIPLQEYIRAHFEDKVNELPPKSIIITFDDGHKGNFKLLDIISGLKLPVTIYLCSEIVGTKRGYWFNHIFKPEKKAKLKILQDDDFTTELSAHGFELDAEQRKREALSDAEILKMKSSPFVDLQSHTCYHFMLDKCTSERCEYEVAHSKISLESKYGLQIYSLSYPNSNYGEREVELAKKANYQCAVTVDQGYNGNDEDLFRLKRLSVNDTEDLNEFIVKASGLWALITGK